MIPVPEIQTFSSANIFNDSFSVNYDIMDDFVKFNTPYGETVVSKYNPTFIHDYTISEKLTKSDKQLDNLTPDFVTDETVIEFSTAESNNPQVLFDRFRMKYVKYQQLALKHSKELIVKIIGLNSVVSNKLDIETDLDYVRRFNLALKLRSDIFRSDNISLWFSESKTRMFRTFESVIENHKSLTPQDDFEKTLDIDLPPVSKEIFTDFVNLCTKEMLNFHVENIDHTKEYKCEGTRHDYKRVIPVSLVIPQPCEEADSFRSSLLNPDVDLTTEIIDRAPLIEEAMKSIKIEYNSGLERSIAMGEQEVPPKRTKNMYRFYCKLDNNQKTKLALSGVQAKKLYKDRNQEIVDKRNIGKIAFNYEAPTDDIDNFIRTNHLIEYEGFKSKTIADSFYREWSMTLRTFREETRGRTSLNELLILDEFHSATKMTLIQFVMFLQALFTEINLSVRENLDEDCFIVKPVPGYMCDVYIKVTGSMKPVFFFILFRKEYEFKNKTVGVKFDILPDTNYYISEWSSVKIRDIESYLSITSKMLSSLFYLKQLHTDETIISQHINFLLLLLLSNKDRDEEIVTLLRYVYMRSASYTDNVTTLVSKLPTCVRSRLNLYQIKQTLSLMNRLHKSKPTIVMTEGDRDLSGLHDLFGNKVNFKQALNFCYYGYIVNKSKQTEANQSSKLIDKILEYDLKIDDGSELAGVGKDAIRDHLHNREFLSVICHLAKAKVIQTFGHKFEEHFMDDLMRTFSKQNMLNLASIKASAKQNLPDSLEGDNLNLLKKRRPKVAESLKKLVDEYGDFEHPIELVNYCVSNLSENDSFNVELFSKDQHAGIREIYVVDIKVRIIQWFLETISRCLCRLFPSETMTNPNMKDYISQRLTRDVMLQTNEPILLCRSGDASKWSQTQNVTKFYQVLKVFLPKKLHSIIKSILMLWYRKKIYLPASLIDICLKFKGELKNDSVNFIRKIFSGEQKDKRLQKNQPFLRIQTGFMQGILHFTSSFFHTVVQEGFLAFKTMLVMKMFPEVRKDTSKFYNLILQGSDDNSEVMVIPKALFKKAPNFFKTLVQLKDIMSKYVGIKVSCEKTASCVPFLMEYNSTWELAGKFVMPTIKFVFSSIDIPQKQTLVGRQEFYYASLSNCLEKGCTIKTCCLIRLSQAEQHYLQLGYKHNPLFGDYKDLITVNKSPALGYFMFEPTVVTGLIGFDFMLYFHSIETVFCNYIQHEEKTIPTQILNNMGYKSLADYTISKFQYKRYDEIMESLNLGEVQISRDFINQRPEVLYTTIHDKTTELNLINLKMHDFSVKESLSSRFSKSEMFSSLIYILSRPVCYFNRERNSLLKLCRDLNNEKGAGILGRSKIKKSFSRSLQYEKIIEDIKPLINTNILMDQTYIQRGSSKIKILDGLNQESYKLLDLCKAKWFNIRAFPIDDFVLDKYFKMAQVAIPWLKTTEQETRETLECDSFQLYYYLINSFKDSKYIKLLDTPGRKGNLTYVISRIADVNKKLVYVPSFFTKSDDQLSKIRSNIKFICDYPYDDSFKKMTLRSLLRKYSSFDLSYNELQTVKLALAILEKDKYSFYHNLVTNSDNLNLVIFTKPQKFDEGKGLWVGKGVILAKAGKLIYELMLEDNKVKKISVNNLILARNSVSTILKTISDLKMKVDNQGFETLRLNPSGFNFDKIGVEVIETPQLSFNLLNVKNVDVVIENGRIKIISRVKSSELTTETLMDDLPDIEMVKIKNDKSSDFEWIPKYKLKRGEKTYGNCTMNEKHAVQTVTLSSIRCHRFNFDKNHEPLFKIDKLASFFWNENQSPSELINLINDIINDNNVKKICDFLDLCHINERSQNVFRLNLFGKVSSRDTLINKISEESENDNDRIDINKMFEELFQTNMLKEFDTVIDENLYDTLMSMNDELNNYMNEFEDKILEFADELNNDEKKFYLQYTSNEVMCNKVFETLYYKIKMNYPEVNLINYEKIDYDEFKIPTSYKNVFCSLFGFPLKLSTSSERNELKDPSNRINLDDLAFNEALIEKLHSLDKEALYDIVESLGKTLFFKDYLKDILEQYDFDIDQFKTSYNKQNSIAIKNRILIRINGLSDQKEKLVSIMNNYEEIITFMEEEERKSEELKLINEKEDPLENEPKISINDDDDFDLDLEFDEFDSDKPIDYIKETFCYSKRNLIEKQLEPEVGPLIKVSVPGDGGCLFYSMMHCLLSKKPQKVIIYYQMLRSYIVDDLKKLKDIDSIRIAMNNPKYPENLRENGEWGDTYCLTVFGIKINAVFYLRQNDEWIGCYGARISDDTDKFYIEYLNGNHFEPLIEESKYDNYQLELKEFTESAGDFKY